MEVAPDQRSAMIDNERLENIVEMMEQDCDDAVEYRKRPEGGQQVGPPSTPFANTPPSGIAAVRKYARWIRELLEIRCRTCKRVWKPGVLVTTPYMIKGECADCQKISPGAK